MKTMIPLLAGLLALASCDKDKKNEPAPSAAKAADEAPAEKAEEPKSVPQAAEAKLSEQEAIARFEKATAAKIFGDPSLKGSVTEYMQWAIKDATADSARWTEANMTTCPLGRGDNCVTAKACVEKECAAGAEFSVAIYVGDRDGGTQLVLGELNLTGLEATVVSTAKDVKKGIDTFVGDSAVMDEARLEQGEEDDAKAAKECCCETVGDAVHFDMMSEAECTEPSMDGKCVAASECKK